MHLKGWACHWLLLEGSGRRAHQEDGKKHVKCIGWQSSETLREYYSGCKALIFPGEEDFGIVPLEAQACGKPVIAFAKRRCAGNCIWNLYRADAENNRETARDTNRGVFTKQTTESLMEAVKFFEHNKNLFDPLSIRKHAEGFDKLIFKEKFKQYIEEIIKQNRLKNG